jgi:hypothetical protein
MTRPPKRLCDPGFRYYNSANTDLRRTFARVRRELAIDARREAEQARDADAIAAEAAAKVAPLLSRRKGNA